MRQKKTWIVSGGALAVLLVAGAVTVPQLVDGGESSQPSISSAAPATTATTAPATTAPAPSPTYPAVTNFYKQAGPPNGSPLAAVDPQTVTVSADQTGTSMSASQVGISLEATDLSDATLSADNQGLVGLLKGVGQPVLRFGGNAVDRRFFWTSTGEAIPADYKGDKTHKVASAAPADFERLNGLLEATGAKISLTVDLGHYDPARAADMVKHASNIFGERLLAVTIGNEPNGFSFTGLRDKDYGVDAFLVEAKAYADAIFAVAPNVPISGPGAYSASWWDPFMKNDLQQQKVLSFHYYPLSDCEAGVPANAPTMANLVSPQMHTRAEQYFVAALKVGQENKVATWLPETGISSCPGSNETTKTYASALWAADFALSAAQSGISQVSFHSSLMTCKGGPPMSVICSEGAYLQPTGVVNPRANYYGMAMAGSVGDGKFLKLENTGGGLAYSYAVEKADGSTTVVLVNQNDPEKAAQTNVTLKLPKNPATATMTQMAGPSYAAEDGMAIDGGAGGVTPQADRPAPVNFKPGQQTQTFPLTAGTVSVLNFTY